MYEKFFWKTINNSTCQPLSSRNHDFPNKHPDDAQLGCRLSSEDSKLSLISNKRKTNKKGTRTLLGVFSRLLTFTHSLCFLSRSHVPLLVEKYIHMIYKKKGTMMTNIGGEVQASSSAFFMPPPPLPPSPRPFRCGIIVSCSILWTKSKSFLGSPWV